MNEKKYSFFKMQISNLLIFLLFALAISLMQAKLKVWFIFLVILSISLFESFFYYRKNGKSFEDMEKGKVLECGLMAVASTVLLFGSILFLIALFKSQA